MAFKDETLRTISTLLYEGKTQTEVREIVPELRERPKNAVWRAVEAAIKKGFLIINIQSDTSVVDELQTQLSLPPSTRLHVVPDNGSAQGDDKTLNSVCYAAAGRIDNRIRELLESGTDEVVVGVGGGMSLSKVAEYSRCYVQDFGVTNRLKFVSLNSAVDPRGAHLSADYIAAQLAQVYSCQHLIRLGVIDKTAEEDHRTAVDNLALVVLGAGARGSSYYTRAAEVPEDIFPETTVGDLNYILIDEAGDPVSVPAELIETLDKLGPTLSHTRLKEIASQNRTIVVIAEHSEPSKEAIGLALLKGGLGSEVFMGISLAQRVRRHAAAGTPVC